MPRPKKPIELVLKKPEIKTVLFVGGESNNLPRLKPDITVHHWDNNDRVWKHPHPDPDLVIIMIVEGIVQGAVSRGYDLANKLKINYIKVYNFLPSRMVDNGVERKLDIRHIFSNDLMLQLPILGPRKKLEIIEKNKDADRKRNRKITPDVAAFIIDTAPNFKYKHPLSEKEAQQLANLVKSNFGFKVSPQQVQKAMRNENKRRLTQILDDTSNPVTNQSCGAAAAAASVTPELYSPSTKPPKMTETPCASGVTSDDAESKELAVAVDDESGECDGLCKLDDLTSNADVLIKLSRLYEQIVKLRSDNTALRTEKDRVEYELHCVRRELAEIAAKLSFL